jgi:hypothetical protein
MLFAFFKRVRSGHSPHFTEQSMVSKFSAAPTALFTAFCLLSSCFPGAPFKPDAGQMPGVAAQVTKLTVTAASKAVAPNAFVDLSAAVEGTGAFSRDVTWKIVSGGGGLSASVGASVKYSSAGVAVDTDVTVEAASAMNPQVTARATVKVANVPLVSAFTAEVANPPTGRVVSGVPVGGGKVKLKWSVLNSTSVEILSGAEKLTTLGALGEKEVDIVQTTEFVLTAKNDAGEVQAKATVKAELQGVYSEAETVRGPLSDGTTILEAAAVDSEGNAYAHGSLPAGSACGKLGIGQFAKTAAGFEKRWVNGFELQPDRSGFCSTGVRAVKPQRDGSVLVCGATSSRFPASTINVSRSGEKAWVAKLSKDGKPEWVTQLDTQSSDSFEDCTMTTSGEVYAVGGLAQDNEEDRLVVQVAQFTAAGKLKGVSQLGAAGGNKAYKIALRSDGRASVAGYGRVPGAAGDPIIDDAWLATFDFAENSPRQVTMTRILAPEGTTPPSGLVVDAANNAYLVGATSGTFPGKPSAGGGTDVWLAQVTETGERGWVTQFGTDGSDLAGEIIADPAGDLIVSGSSNKGFLAPNATTYRASTDVWVHKFDSKGKPEWVTQFGSDVSDVQIDMAFAPSGQLQFLGATLQTGVIPFYARLK